MQTPYNKRSIPSHKKPRSERILREADEAVVVPMRTVRKMQILKGMIPEQFCGEDVFYTTALVELMQQPGRPARWRKKFFRGIASHNKPHSAGGTLNVISFAACAGVTYEQQTALVSLIYGESIF